MDYRRKNYGKKENKKEQKVTEDVQGRKEERH